jgi:hypothetical protein
VNDPSLDEDCKNTKRFLEVVEIINEEYPEIEVTGHIIEGSFGPALIEDLSKKWNIPINFMFIASPGDRFPYRVEQLGGVRLII